MRIWIDAARPKTLIAAIAPILVASAWAALTNHINTGLLAAILISATAIQIGTNFANDYFDHKKGGDTSERLGPTRATHAGLIAPETMKRAFIIAFAIAALFGVYLIWHGGWPIAIIGAFSILFGIGYTAGPLPLAYKGLGDVFVFLFFGLVSVGGTYYLHTGHIQPKVWLLGIACGCLSTAILAINNLRDRAEDSKTGKKTLAVRLGATFVRLEYTLCIYIGFLAFPLSISINSRLQWGYMAAIVGFAIISRRLVRRVWKTDGAGLNDMLADTGKYYALWAMVMVILIMSGY
jgi:1,4-dihydroxy-2-naphthoate octaprenyltransferase